MSEADLAAKREAAYKAWEAKWEKQDFSWEGLAKRSWNAPVDFPGPGEVVGEGETAYKKSNLQEYWRWTLPHTTHDGRFRLFSDRELLDADLLKKIDGTLWHVLHLEDTEAENHPALAPAILARLGAATGYAEFGSGPDHRAQFTGARASGLDRLWRKYADSQDAAPGDKPHLHLAASWSELHHAHCYGLVFGDNSKFDHAIFSGPAFVSFGHATFTGNARFEDATFISECHFADAHFVGNADFQRTKFWQIANFSRIQFSGDAGFQNTQFFGSALFDASEFCEDADFSNTQFSNLAQFIATQFSDYVHFTGTTFEGTANFSRAQFNRQAYFIRTAFRKLATWHTGEFKQFATFEGSTWGFGNYNWRFKYFGPWKPEDFEHIHYSRAFFGTRFLDVANFETDHFNAFAAFDGAQFEKALYLKDEAQRDAHKARFREACEAVEQQIEADIDGDETRRDEEATKRWNELSSGYRTAKAVMERHGAVERAQRYYRYEVQARLKKPSTTWPEKAAAGVYDAVSDYGASISRPLIWLFLLIFYFAAIYLFIACASGNLALGPVRLGAPIAPDVLDAISLSFRNAFLNLDSFSGGPVNTARTSETLFGKGGWSGVARVLGVFQTFLSLILAFLFALAVRRKFQIR